MGIPPGARTGCACCYSPSVFHGRYCMVRLERAPTGLPRRIIEECCADPWRCCSVSVLQVVSVATASTGAGSGLTYRHAGGQLGRAVGRSSRSLEETRRGRLVELDAIMPSSLGGRHGQVAIRPVFRTTTRQAGDFFSSVILGLVDS